MPLFLNPSWGEYNTTNFVGWPSEQNPYARISPNNPPETFVGDDQSQEGSLMIRYALRRLFFYGLAGCMAIVINFFLPRLMPGDPVTTMFAKFRGKLKPEALESMKKTFGLSEAPLHIQFWEYLQALLSGDFGTSLAYFPMPVSDVISMGLLWTVYLSGIASSSYRWIGTFLGVASLGGEVVFWIMCPLYFSFLGAFPYFGWRC